MTHLHAGVSIRRRQHAGEVNTGSMSDQNQHMSLFGSETDDFGLLMGDTDQETSLFDNTAAPSFDDVFTRDFPVSYLSTKYLN